MEPFRVQLDPLEIGPFRVHGPKLYNKVCTFDMRFLFKSVKNKIMEHRQHGFLLQRVLNLQTEKKPRKLLSYTFIWRAIASQKIASSLDKS